MQSLQKGARNLRNEFEELIVQFRPDLWKYCLYLTRSPWDAEDLSQDTIIKAFSHMSHLYQVVNLKSYLFRIASNLWIDWCRRAKRFQQTSAALEESLLPSTEVDQLDVLDSIEVLIRYLPPKQRIAVLLADVFEFRLRETADMLSTTEGAIKAALSRARSTLRSSSLEEPKTAVKMKVPSPLIDAYLRAFNERDPDAIAALLNENAVADIVGVSQEYGRDTIRSNSLADWVRDPVPSRAVYLELDGTSFVAVYSVRDGQDVLETLIRLDETDGLITYTNEYYFCPELLIWVAHLLYVEADTHGYFWGDRGEE
ncbi:sigma-70 family RNA polymerase sigma factor [Alicyclobacillus sp. ALC3]|uniref:sigma-70 family RNA polymerase sigma factor n=1 Tax=Alicyclobacillus sp. ALC3 TaxID=2796143 RepID=UPI0023797D83|nr:sigma-70 family RNA polymerase sigma factor [Alicyclobacillus sp. ALC3]WDL96694.1 sigma-70 family RNA polymerase sigma factor [Alicyclobacillus sp. ALC3]